MVQKPIKSVENDPKTPFKAISTLNKNYPLQPSPKLDVEKKLMNQKSIKLIKNNPKTRK